MATNKKKTKKEVKMRDLKPSKDAKGGSLRSVSHLSSAKLSSAKLNTGKL
jgi:hypothetical protein